MLSIAMHCRAADWEHLGSPPPGVVFVELRSDVSVNPVQLAGTIDPPTLILNGKSLEAKPTHEMNLKSSDPSGMGLWINAVPKSGLNGSIGRFFVSLTGDEAATTKLEVVMRTKEGKFFKADVALDRTFLEAPFRVVQAYDEGQNIPEKNTFFIRGPIPANSKLDLNDAEVRPEFSDRAEVILELKTGRAVFSGKLHLESGAQRVLNVPVSVQKRKFEEGAVIFSIEVPRASKGQNEPYRTWDIPDYGATLYGTTNPGAEVLVNEQPVPVSASGKFSYFLDPDSSEWSEQFRRSLQFKVKFNGKYETFSKKLECSECLVAKPWYSPRFRRAGTWFITVPLVQVAWMVPRNGRIVSDFSSYALSSASAPVTPIAGLGGGRYLKHFLALEGGFHRMLLTMKSGTAKQTLQNTNTDVVYAGATVSWIPALSVGAGLSYLRTSVKSSGYSISPNGLSQSIALYFSVRARFAVARIFEFTPGFVFYPASLSYPLTSTSVRWYLMAVEPFAVRFYL